MNNSEMVNAEPYFICNNEKKKVCLFTFLISADVKEIYFRILIIAFSAFYAFFLCDHTIYDISVGIALVSLPLIFDMHNIINLLNYISKRNIKKISVAKSIIFYNIPYYFSCFVFLVSIFSIIFILTFPEMMTNKIIIEIIYILAFCILSISNIIFVIKPNPIQDVE